MDATPFLEGKNSLFLDLVREDDRLASLLCFDYGPNIELMLKQCLELIFGGFVSISKKMPKDHLHGGIVPLLMRVFVRKVFLFPQSMPIPNKILAC